MWSTAGGVVRRDRAIVAAGLIGITLIGWAYLYHDASTMHCERMAMPNTAPWNAGEFGLMFIMWTIMMVAMMIPSASPMLLSFAAVNRRRLERDAPYVSTSVFLLGYLLVWTLFSLAATVMQGWLQAGALVSSAMVSTSSVFAGALLVTAGVFQWTPLKRRCLTHCHAPLSFLTAHWREGRTGALVMGVHHGLYCVGCCWAVMLLLFVAGVMNLFWVATIAAFVLLEKLMPRFVSPLGGALMVCAGIWMLV
jgi:predicted metal-binding membrane protein